LGATYHDNPDTWSDDELVTDPSSLGELSFALASLQTAMMRHAQNVAAPGEGPDEDEPLNSQSHSQRDQLLRFVTPGPNASDPSSIVLTIAACWKLYEAHRKRTSIHLLVDEEDEDVVLNASVLPPIATLHLRFLEALDIQLPTQPSTAHAALVRLAPGGFKE